jgi:SOS response regulatory protein OraA/RecX
LAQALRQLARRDLSISDLRAGLLRGGHRSAEVNRTIARLRARRLLDDAAFAERFTRRALVNRGLGRRRIAFDLAARGVAPKPAAAGMAEALHAQPEAALLDTLAPKLWERQSRLAPAQRLRRVWSQLLRRGFDPALVGARLRRLCPGCAEELEALESSANDEAERD